MTCATCGGTMSIANRRWTGTLEWCPDCCSVDTKKERQMTQDNQELKMRIAKIEIETAQAGALEWFDGVIATLERGVKDLKYRRAQMQDAVADGDTGMASPTSVLSWAINDISNISMNIRLDMAVQRGAELKMAMARRETTK